MSLTKAELIESLCSTMGLSKKDAKEIVVNFFGTISQALADGEEVKISGFGNFNLKNKKERPGRNPRTGKEVTIASRRVVTFKQGQKLKSLVSKAQSEGIDS